MAMFLFDEDNLIVLLLLLRFFTIQTGEMFLFNDEDNYRSSTPVAEN